MEQKDFERSELWLALRRGEAKKAHGPDETVHRFEGQDSHVAKMPRVALAAKCETL